MYGDIKTAKDRLSKSKNKALEGKRGEGKIAKGNEGKSKVKDEKDAIKRFHLA